MNKILLFCIVCFACVHLIAQPRGGGARQNMNVGHLYGKIVDSTTNKGIDGATIQLVGKHFDTTTKKAADAVVATLFTEHNGDFDIESVPVFGELQLRVTNIGYADLNKKVSFGFKRPQGGNNAASGEDRMQQAAGMVDKDLGNIKLAASSTTLAGVTVTASAKPFFEMGVDRKIFNVDKNIVSTGQTATEVMKQIPTLNVDIDGNVTLRNATPQLFVDGRPTTLTLDQIPADIIDKVELITNPSAKFDASGGNAGILNIVLKKNRKTGYNGGIRAGIDSRGRPNGGVDLNLRQNKFNFFINANYNRRKSKSTSNTERYNFGQPPSTVLIDNKQTNTGYFAFLRGGFDYFLDNRNTITVSGSYVRGKFNNVQPQTVDSLISDSVTSNSLLDSRSSFGFKNYGGQFSFKHNFTQNGHDITADINYNSSTNSNNSSIDTRTYYPEGLAFKYPTIMQRTYGNGYNRFFTVQSDYENPINDNNKIEAGVRAAIRNFRSSTDQYFFNDDLDEFILSNGISSNYKYTDKVYAAYGTYTLKAKKWNYQLGLRVESSNYNGSLLGKDSAFKIKYPVSLFPSAFITYKLTDQQDLQLNYSRRINRPNFFQLIPFVDYTDPQYISIGNAGLKPEFTNSFEFSYDNNYTKGASFLASAFFKYTTDLITRYQYKDLSPVTKVDSAIFNTYANANHSLIYGLELTNKVTLVKIWDLTLNVNFFDSKINGDNIQSGLSNQGFSWFAKMNNSFKLPKGFSIQFSGNYQAKTVLPPNSGGGGGGGRGGGGGGGGFGGGPIATAQGYIKPLYGFDAAIRKDWTWKGGNSASLTLSMNDVFRTQLYKTHSESPFLIQDQERRRDPQIARLNFSYRFGKFDVSLFKRKNTKADQGVDQGSLVPSN